MCRQLCFKIKQIIANVYVKILVYVTATRHFICYFGYIIPEQNENFQETDIQEEQLQWKMTLPEANKMFIWDMSLEIRHLIPLCFKLSCKRYKEIQFYFYELMWRPCHRCWTKGTWLNDNNIKIGMTFRRRSVVLSNKLPLAFGDLFRL